MAEIVFDPDATIAVKNGRIDIPHFGKRAEHESPTIIHSPRVGTCRDWNGNKGCLFYRGGECIARTQCGLDMIMPFVSLANNDLERVLHKRGDDAVPTKQRRIWRVNRILEKMVKRRMIPLGYNRNRTVSISCPESVFRGDVAISNDTA